jgi:ABC-type spermidine/putrescine transport system permease subunit II
LTVWYTLDRFPRSVLESAQLDGAGPWTALVWIVLPQRMAAMTAIWLAGLAITTGDLAWSILVLRPGIDTLQRRLFGDIHAGADDRVAGACLAVSILFGLAVVVAMLQARKYQRSRRAETSA